MRTLPLLLASLLLPACSTATQPIQQFGALPETNSGALARHLARMAPSPPILHASADDLLYVSDQSELYGNAVDVFSLPQAKFVGHLSLDSSEILEGLCSDGAGNVWILGWTTNGQAFYDKYAHGGANPIGSIIASGIPNGCAVDAKTGDLAVANFVDYSVGRSAGDLAVYAGGQGQATDYDGNTIKHYYYCAYDDKGNLFADGDNSAFNELPKGSSSVRNLYLDHKITPGSLQWDGKYISVVALGGSKGPTRLDRLTFSGSNGQIAGTTILKTPGNYGTYLTVQFAVGDGSIVGPGGGDGGPARRLYVWPYPAGGMAKRSVTEGSYPNFYGVAFSAAAKGTR